MKKLNCKILSIVLTILTLLSLGGITTFIVQSPGGVYAEPDDPGPGS